MTQLILNIPNEQDITWLIPLLERLGLSVNDVKNHLTSEEVAYHQTIIAMGGTDQENLEDYLAEFKESRQDRVLPFRE